MLLEDDGTGTHTTLKLHCEKCGFPRIVRDYPVCGIPPRGTVLGAEAIGIYRFGCLKCGVCRFVVDMDPPPKAEPLPPAGWVKKVPGAEP